MRIPVVLCAAAMSAASLVVLAQQAPTDADVEAGREYFVADGCYQCHGRVGQGGRGTVLIPMRLPYEAYRVIVRQPSGSMPAYTQQVMSEERLAATYAYLLSLPSPRAAEDLPELLKP